VERLKETLNNTAKAVFIFPVAILLLSIMMITFLTFAVKSDVNAFSLSREETRKDR
jgi:hypothetical protein